MIVQIQQTSLLVFVVTAAIIWFFKDPETKQSALGKGVVIVLFASILSAIVAVVTTLYIIWT